MGVAMIPIGFAFHNYDGRIAVGGNGAGEFYAAGGAGDGGGDGSCITEGFCVDDGDCEEDRSPGDGHGFGYGMWEGDFIAVYDGFDGFDEGGRGGFGTPTAHRRR